MASLVAFVSHWSWQLIQQCLQAFRWSSSQIGRHLYAWFGFLKTDNALAGDAEERVELLAWVNKQLPGQRVTNFSSDWTDGQRLSALVNALAPRAMPSDQQYSRQQPVVEVEKALSRAKLLLKVDPTLTVTDVVWTADERKMMQYLTQLRESATRLKKRFTLVKTPSFMATADPAPHLERGADPAQCVAKGDGLLRAERGRTAEFSIVFPRTSQPDLLLELRSEAGDFFTQRVTERSPPRLALADSLRAVSGTVLLRNIPVGYRVTGRSVMVTYRAPSEGRLEVSVVWRGHHVTGSPFTVMVESGEPEAEDVVQEKDRVKVVVSPPEETSMTLTKTDVVTPLGATLRPLAVLRELSREDDHAGLLLMSGMHGKETDLHQRTATTDDARRQDNMSQSLEDGEKEEKHQVSLQNEKIQQLTGAKVSARRRTGVFCNPLNNLDDRGEAGQSQEDLLKYDNGASQRHESPEDEDQVEDDNTEKVRIHALDYLNIPNMENSLKASRIPESEERDARDEERVIMDPWQEACKERVHKIDENDDAKHWQGDGKRTPEHHASQDDVGSNCDGQSINDVTREQADIMLTRDRQHDDEESEDEAELEQHNKAGCEHNPLSDKSTLSTILHPNAEGGEIGKNRSNDSVSSVCVEVCANDHTAETSQQRKCDLSVEVAQETPANKQSSSDGSDLSTSSHTSVIGSDTAVVSVIPALAPRVFSACVSDDGENEPISPVDPQPRSAPITSPQTAVSAASVAGLLSPGLVSSVLTEFMDVAVAPPCDRNESDGDAGSAAPCGAGSTDGEARIDVHQDPATADTHQDWATTSLRQDPNEIKPHRETTTCHFESPETRDETNSCGQPDIQFTRDDFQEPKAGQELETDRNVCASPISTSEPFEERRSEAQNTDIQPASDKELSIDRRHSAGEQLFNENRCHRDRKHSLPDVWQLHTGLTEPNEKGAIDGTPFQVGKCKEAVTQDSTVDDENDGPGNNHLTRSDSSEDSSDCDQQLSLKAHVMAQKKNNDESERQLFMEPQLTANVLPCDPQLHGDTRCAVSGFEVHFERVSDDSSSSSSGGGSDDTGPSPPTAEARPHPARLSPIASSGEEVQSSDSRAVRSPSPEGRDRGRLSDGGVGPSRSIGDRSPSIGDLSLSIATRTRLSTPQTISGTRGGDLSGTRGGDQLSCDADTAPQGQSAPGDVIKPADSHCPLEKSTSIGDDPGTEKQNGGCNAESVAPTQQRTHVQSSETERDLSPTVVSLSNTNLPESAEVLSSVKTAEPTESQTKGESVYLSFDFNQDDVPLRSPPNTGRCIKGENYGGVNDNVSTNSTNKDEATATLPATIIVTSLENSQSSSDTPAAAGCTESNISLTDAEQRDTSNPLPLLLAASGASGDEGRELAPTTAPANPPRKYSDLYSNFEMPSEPRYRLHAEHDCTKVYLGPALSRARATVVRVETPPCVLRSDPPPPAAQSDPPPPAAQSDPPPTAAQSDPPPTAAQSDPPPPAAQSDPPPTAVPAVRSDDRWDADDGQVISISGAMDEAGTAALPPPATPPPSPQPGETNATLGDTPTQTQDITGLMTPGETLMAALSDDRLVAVRDASLERATGSFEHANDEVGNGVLTGVTTATDDKKQEQQEGSDIAAEGSLYNISGNEDEFRRMLPRSKPPDKLQTHEDIIEIQECPSQDSVCCLSADGDRSSRDAEQAPELTPNGTRTPEKYPRNEAAATDASLHESSDNDSQVRKLNDEDSNTELHSEVCQHDISSGVIISKGLDSNGNAIYKVQYTKDEMNNKYGSPLGDYEGQIFNQIIPENRKSEAADDTDKSTTLVKISQGPEIDEIEKDTAGLRYESVSSPDSSESAATVKAICSTPVPRTLSSCSQYSGVDSTDTGDSLPDDAAELQLPSGDSTELQLANGDSTELQLASGDSTELQLPSGDSTELQLPSGDSTELQLPSGDSTELQLPNGDSTELQLPSGDSTELQLPSGDSTELQLPSVDSTELQLASGDSTELQLPSGDSTELQLASGDSTELQLPSGDSTEQQLGSGDSTELQLPSGDSTELQLPSVDSTELQLASGDSTELQLPSGDSTELQLANGDSTELQLPSGDSTELQLPSGDSTELQLPSVDSTELQLASGDSTELQLPSGDSTELQLASGDSTELQLASGDSTELQLASGDSTELQLASGDSTELQLASGDSTELQLASGDSTELQLASGDSTELQLPSGDTTELQLPSGGSTAVTCSEAALPSRSASAADSENTCSLPQVNTSGTPDTMFSRDSSKLVDAHNKGFQIDFSSAVEEPGSPGSESDSSVTESETGKDRAPRDPGSESDSSVTEPETGKDRAPRDTGSESDSSITESETGKDGAPRDTAEGKKRRLVSSRTVYWAPGTPPPQQQDNDDEPVLLHFVKIDPDPITLGADLSQTRVRSVPDPDTITTGTKVRQDSDELEVVTDAKLSDVASHVEESGGEAMMGSHGEVPVKECDQLEPATVVTVGRVLQIWSDPQEPEIAPTHEEPAVDLGRRKSGPAMAGNWLLSSPASPDGYVARIVRSHSVSGEHSTPPMPGGRRHSPTNFSLEETKKMLERGNRSEVKSHVEPLVEIGAEGRVVRLREMFEQMIQRERRAGGRSVGLHASRSLASLPGSVDDERPEQAPLSTDRRRCHSSAGLRRPADTRCPGQPAESRPQQQQQQQQQRRAGDAAAATADSGGQTHAASHRLRGLSCSAAVGPTSITSVEFEAIRRYFEGLRDGRIVDGSTPAGRGRSPRQQTALRWLRRRWPAVSAPAGRFDLGRAGLRRSLGALPPPLSPPHGEDADDGLDDAERVVLAPAPAASPAPVPRVMTEYPYLSQRRSRPRLLARQLIPHQELVRRARDRVVVFGPGLFQGSVGADNTFQLYVPEPQCAPQRVTVRAASPAAAALCQLRYLGYMYHEVRYRVSEGGWYRVTVTLGAHAADVDVIVRVT